MKVHVIAFAVGVMRLAAVCSAQGPSLDDDGGDDVGM
jgi:hypothetical protein